jgi:O-6-methylguanine DNA methyltransferase
MARRVQEDITEVRRLVRELRTLAEVDAPETLVSGALARLGLGDGYWTLDTPLGVVYVAYTGAGISAVIQADSPATFERMYRERFGRVVRRVREPPEGLARAVRRRLLGERGQAPHFDLRGVSDFERAVLLKALEIPRGEVRPYAWIAREIGRPKAVRAVGNALAENPIPLLIPCHRVVNSDGRLGRYSMGGPEAKRTVLAAEGVALATLEAHARAGVRFYGSDTTHIFCFPTCRHARRVSDSHLVLFSSEADAEAAGYRPCKVCRPAQAS